jgi:hypothetical protein
MRVFRWLVALGAVLALLVGFAVPAYASNADGPSGPRAFELVLNSWPVLLAAGAGFLSSQLTAFLTHEKAPQWIKSLTNLVFTSLGGVLITVQTVPGHTWKDYVGVIVAGEIAALATHYIGLTAALQAATANFGIGGATPPLVAPSGTTVTTAPLGTVADDGSTGAY